MTESIKVERKWFVVFGCFCINFVLFGLQRSTGVLYVALLAQFGSSREKAAWPAGLTSIIITFIGPLAILLSHYWSIRVTVFLGSVLTSVGIALCYFAYNMTFITFFYGVIPGVGLGFILALTHVIINQHFEQKRATAAGLSYSGSCIGSFVFPPITEYLLKNYGLRGAFLLLGGVALHSLIGAMLYFPAENLAKSQILPSNVKGNATSTRELKEPANTFTNDCCIECEKQILSKICFSENFRMLTDIIRSPMFIIISTTFAFSFFASGIYLMIIVDFALDKSVNENQAVFLISGYSAGDLSGRLISGWIADLKRVKRKYIVVITMLCLGILTSSMPCTNTYWSLMNVSICLGFMAGCTMINFSAIMTEYIGIQKLPMAIGLTTIPFGTLNCIRPLLIGHFRDKTGTYDYLFYIIGASLICSSVIWLLEPMINKHCGKRKPHQNKEMKNKESVV